MDIHIFGIILCVANYPMILDWYIYIYISGIPDPSIAQWCVQQLGALMLGHVGTRKMHHPRKQTRLGLFPNMSPQGETEHNE